MGNLHYRLRAPKCLTSEEVEKLLTTTGERVNGLRDHVLYSLALGTGLREHELEALNWEHMLTLNGRGRGIKERVEISTFKGDNKGGVQVVVLPLDCRRKVWALYQSRPKDERTGPVFVSRQRNRLCTRQMRGQFKKWCIEAGISHMLTFHSLRHTFCRRLLDASKDITIVCAAARHSRITTTYAYLQPNDEDVTKAVRRLRA